MIMIILKINVYCHNPYFNRWFSAISKMDKYPSNLVQVTILILIDGFLQFKTPTDNEYGVYEVTILILIDGFLQFH